MVRFCGSKSNFSHVATRQGQPDQPSRLSQSVEISNSTMAFLIKHHSAASIAYRQVNPTSGLEQVATCRIPAFVMTAFDALARGKRVRDDPFCAAMKR